MIAATVLGLTGGYLLFVMYLITPIDNFRSKMLLGFIPRIIGTVAIAIAFGLFMKWPV